MAGRDWADADAQTTPEGEAEQTTILVKAGITTDYKGKRAKRQRQDKGGNLCLFLIASVVLVDMLKISM